MTRLFILLAALWAGVLSGYAQSSITDIDGNVYPVIVIGSQEWMGENLRTTRYRNGESLHSNLSHTFRQESEEGIWLWYDYNQSHELPYGKLYNWYAVSDPRGLCPAGWRVPTDYDWQQLADFIDPDAKGNTNRIGNKLKSRRQVNSPLGSPWDTQQHPRWNSHRSRFGTDNFGFAALPAGGATMGEAFVHMGQQAYFWSRSEANPESAWVRTLLFSHRGMSRSAYQKQLALSVRCIKGNEPDFYTLTLVADPSEGGSVNGAGSYEAGQLVSISATPKEGYTFVNWTQKDTLFSLNPAFSYHMPAEDVTLKAGFQKQILHNNLIIIKDAVGNPGEEITLKVEMQNLSDIIAFQMDFELPAGFTYVAGSYILSERAQGHIPSESMLTGNKLRVLAYSMNNNPFLGETGLLLTFKVLAPAKTGEYTFNASGVILTGEDFSNLFEGSLEGKARIE
jgi:uncharacterized protein (TIGR02145 family)/uncharacterized repeat protein (TIGR02543 family)